MSEMFKEVVFEYWDFFISEVEIEWLWVYFDLVVSLLIVGFMWVCIVCYDYLDMRLIGLGLGVKIVYYIGYMIEGKMVDGGNVGDVFDNLMGEYVIWFVIF